MKSQRQEAIKAMFRAKGEVKLKELEERFPECSSMTLRRDIKALEDEGLVKRTRGGAVAMNSLMLITEDEPQRHDVQSTSKKLAIAMRASEFFARGCSVYIDSGTTMTMFSKSIPDEYSSVLTTGVGIAMELMKKKNVLVNIVGGQINKETLSTTGSFATQFINSLNIDIAFLSSAVCSLDSGLSCGTYLECEVKREVIRRARKCIALVDSDKFDRNMPFTFANWEDIDILVTDDGFPEDAIRQIELRGVEVIVV